MIEVSAELKNAVLNFYDKYSNIKDEITSIKLSDDKWSLKEIIGHLIDSAGNNHQRFVRLQIESNLKFPSYHYSWIDIERFNLMNYSDLINLWKYYNLLLCNIINNVNNKTMDNVWEIDESKITLKNLIIDYLRHLKEHISHFEQRFDEVQKAI